ncbi:conserved Plasmodium protein, unknown function [Plasmodium knowlesi strain H]|uniref:Hyaluronan/mRNA-binding protein domain-containing protein n=3 Tax=Plasmodium knowlesi TaxID=5850 RepID=A0A5K1UH19_PLAKH|nr:conserved protein, unknown function [Plasmodium knowlesi strain H]OTN64067.1 Uncharacterized protein PKNOH_S140272700 [Plasmodium knowlesi]CAA9991141.1 conserved protein, unknown function [Plasmodium knowlesi strain H]SBO20541.1 conserved Plasmodium protein, unknown function [Plasmodium knowlesi strain H]SBO20918.1 conserved Plasmodium protein, unknown function [Plasmodium knowlesi strain H]VVS80615.1 conserved protein, unknown function [Plasmodium knowlesi strain H]|eukprot:XP_002262425.1 hypothetical protein, conserved in Plasmodium species [Plasmodium knowlesi strain H]
MTHSAKDKNVRLERHSAGKTQAYGDQNVRAGSGKFNWGNTTTDLTLSETKPTDKNDPMYDSEIEKVTKEGKK